MGEEKKILMREGYPLTGEGGYFLSCNVGGTVMGMGNGYPLMSIHWSVSCNGYPLMGGNSCHVSGHLVSGNLVHLCGNLVMVSP